MQIHLSGRIKELGYFFKGYKNHGSESTIRNAILFVSGLIASPTKTLVGICRAVSGEQAVERMKKCLKSKTVRRNLRAVMDEKSRCIFMHAITRNRNFWHDVYLILDATYVGRYSTTMEDLFFVGKGGKKKVGNHIFLFGLLMLHDGTRIPLRPRLQKTQKTAGKDYKTQVEIADDIVRATGFVKKSLIVVADSYFLSEELTRTIVGMGHHFVIAAKDNRVVMEGRRKRQLRVYASEETIRSRLRKITLERDTSQGRKRSKSYSACLRTLTIQKLGRVAVVFSKKHKQRGADLKMIASDMVDASLEQLVRHYDMRWEIEVFFREIKSQLGFEKCRMQSSVAHENWAILVCLTFEYLQDLSQKHQEEWWKRRGPRGQPRTSDYIQLHAHLVQRNNIEHILRAGSTGHDRRRLVKCFGVEMLQKA